jgi:hypothetical protein
MFIKPQVLMTILGFKSSFVNAILMHANLVISRRKIEFREKTTATQLLKHFVNARQWVLLSDRNFNSKLYSQHTIFNHHPFWKQIEWEHRMALSTGK